MSIAGAGWGQPRSNANWFDDMVPSAARVARHDMWSRPEMGMPADNAKDIRRGMEDFTRWLRLLLRYSVGIRPNFCKFGSRRSQARPRTA